MRDSVVAGYGRVYVGSTGIVQGNGHNNEYSHNEIYDGYKGRDPYLLLQPDVGTDTLPHDNLVAFNLIHDLFQGIMNDSGSIYFGVGTPGAPSQKGLGAKNTPATGIGNIMRNNVVHDVNDASALMDKDGYGGDGLYADDFTSSVLMENNLVYRVSDNAVSFSGPRVVTPPQGGAPYPPSVVKNNILAFARRSMLNAYNPYSFKIGAADAEPAILHRHQQHFLFRPQRRLKNRDARRFTFQGG